MTIFPSTSLWEKNTRLYTKQSCSSAWSCNTLNCGWVCLSCTDLPWDVSGKMPARSLRLLKHAMFFARRMRHRKKPKGNVSISPTFVNGPASFQYDVTSWCVLIRERSNLWQPSHKMVENLSMTSKFRRSPASLSQPAQRLEEVFTIHSIKNHICNVG